MISYNAANLNFSRDDLSGLVELLDSDAWACVFLQELSIIDKMQVLNLSCRQTRPAYS